MGKLNWGCALLIAQLAASTTALGFELKPNELRGNARQKNVSVLQNRFFTKTLRPEIGVSSGMFLNEAYTNTATQGARIGIFLSEWVGLEYQWNRTKVTDTDDLNALEGMEFYPVGENGDAVPDRIVHPEPEINPVYEVQDFNAILAPFYGKLNLFDSMIVYSDVYLTAGATQVLTEQGPITGMSIGAGQRFYLLQSFSLRLDFRDRIYTEERGGKDSTRHALSVDFGASYFIN